MPKSKFLLIVGVSGVGKTTLIRELEKIDNRFTFIKPNITRPLRPSETDKIYMPESELKQREAAGEYLSVTHIFGNYYAVPRETVSNVFQKGLLPILDFAMDYIDPIIESLKGQGFIVYVTPPSLAVLKERLDKDNRDHDGSRLEVATKELEKYHNHEYDKKIDMHIVSHNDKTPQIAQTIYDAYIDDLS